MKCRHLTSFGIGIVNVFSRLNGRLVRITSIGFPCKHGHVSKDFKSKKARKCVQHTATTTVEFHFFLWTAHHDIEQKHSNPSKLRRCVVLASQKEHGKHISQSEKKMAKLGVLSSGLTVSLKRISVVSC